MALEMLYILRDRKAIAIDDLFEWASWMQNNSRKVALDEIDGVEISTVFLAIDHNFTGNGDPLLFETMVFTDGNIGQMDRYFIWEEAEAGHKAIVDIVKQEIASAKSKGTKLLDTIMNTLKT